MNWHDKKILVLGAGDTGLSVVRWGQRVGARVRLADTRDHPPGLDELQRDHADVECLTGSWRSARFDAFVGDAELIVASPGVAVAGPACDPAVARAIAAGKEIVGDIELFARQQNSLTGQNGKKPKVIGITGSNGKSTVTAMAGAMCAVAGLKTVVAGNIGLPVLDALALVDRDGEPDVYVLELSSFQLETTSSLHLEAATMLNLSQDHLDRYASMDDYAAAKQRIFRHARQQVLNREDAASMRMLLPGTPFSSFGTDAAPTATDFGIERQALAEGREALLPLAAMPVTGLHNAANALAAMALCRAIGADRVGIVDGLRHFKGLPHRVENVGVINGVSFYDDSKGTNVGSTVAALNGMTVPVILIAGGEGKEQDFSPLAEPVRKHARAVVLIGKDARLIESAITSARSFADIPSIHAASMADAVETAYARASPGDAVLLSPACASFDMFKNYKHRGEVFAECVQVLKRKVEGGRAV
ncbi:MAG TPA: UDP-N-acetylmuramoyl-L-alanine--D-glutamate ligase [Usitatibacteraceae bacterium]